MLGNSKRNVLVSFSPVASNIQIN